MATANGVHAIMLGALEKERDCAIFGWWCWWWWRIALSGCPEAECMICVIMKMKRMAFLFLFAARDTTIVSQRMQVCTSNINSAIHKINLLANSTKLSLIRKNRIFIFLTDSSILGNWKFRIIFALISGSFYPFCHKKSVDLWSRSNARTTNCIEFDIMLYL